jgi:hypothetical protein
VSDKLALDLVSLTPTLPDSYSETQLISSHELTTVYDTIGSLVASHVVMTLTLLVLISLDLVISSRQSILLLSRTA